MSWKVRTLAEGIAAYENGLEVKVYSPETEVTVGMEVVLGDLNRCFILVDEPEIKPVEAIKPQDVENTEEAPQNPVAGEIQSEAGICEEPKKRRGGRPKKQEGEKPAKEKKPVPVDRGKIRALYEAGWSVADIASDVHQTEETVREVLGL